MWNTRSSEDYQMAPASGRFGIYSGDAGGGPVGQATCALLRRRSNRVRQTGQVTASAGGSIAAGAGAGFYRRGGGGGAGGCAFGVTAW